MTKARFRTQRNGQRIRIELSVKEYEALVDDLEELDSIRAYDAAKKPNEEPIPFEQALKQIERLRK